MEFYMHFRHIINMAENYLTIYRTDKFAVVP